MQYNNDEACPFEEVFKTELHAILNSRDNRIRRNDPADDVRPELASLDTTSPGTETKLEDIANRMRLMGLAFSGGGIRSATFNLGVLQALAGKGLLHYFDYLSTVSGGGYIGSWLSAWISRECENGADAKNPKGVNKVEQALDLSAKIKASGTREAYFTKKEPETVSFLRDYSNYITPRESLLSGDTWTTVSTYARNSFLTLFLLILALSAILLIPRWFPTYVWAFVPQADSDSAVFPVVVGALLALAMGFISFNLAQVDAKGPGGKYTLAGLGSVQLTIVLPILLCALLASVWFERIGITRGWNGLPPAASWALGGGAGYVGLCLLGKVLGYSIAHFGPTGKLAPPRVSTESSRPFLQLILAFPAGALGGLLLYGAFFWMGTWHMDGSSSGELNHLWIVTWGPPLIVLVGMVIVTLHVGLIGRQLVLEVHEWWLRLGGWLAIYGAVWVVWFGVALYAPRVVEKLQETSSGLNTGLIASWAVTTVMGILAGKDPATGGKDPNRWLNVIAKIGPHVFMIGFIVLLAVGWNYFFRSGVFECSKDAPYWLTLARCGIPESIVCLFCAVAAVLFARFFDINLFSLHYFYKNRLVRCYLGASRQSTAGDADKRTESGERRAHPFTGFDPEDDHKLSELCTDYGPYPIINAALNLVGGDKLAWQQRKAASFVFTPRFCGYQVWDREYNDNLAAHAYRRTEDYAGGPLLGTAMAVSGAAFSPNMGYHSSPAVSFLLTVFSVRLGLWIGNPRHRRGFRQKGPLFALFPLFAELFGLTNERRRFCNLSDGGHFENLGIYELVRRRCRFIIALDAGQDDKFSFEDLGNAVRKCRVDLGTEISIRAASLCPDATTKRSARHCAVGSITYPDGTLGTLVYIKPTLTGNEPADILNYASEHAEFPHQTTLDQWFDEAQFESYRKLGYHIASSVLGHAIEQSTGENVASGIDKTEFFRSLRQEWFPPSPTIGKAFTRHAQALDALLERLRKSDDLAFLDTQIYPEWDALTKGAPNPSKSPTSMGLPPEYAHRRAGFYFCNSLIQLMESVYLDLNLEEEYEHPDNRGWMNLFRHWSWSDMVRATWAISAYTFGARFQGFCKAHLGLCLGAINVTGSLPYTSLEHQGAEHLNSFEIALVRSIVEHNKSDINESDAKIITITIELPVSSIENHRFEDGRPLLTFSCGFALATGNQLRYFRIQNHLRKTGLGASALKELLGSKHTIQPALSDVKLFFVPKGAPERPKSHDLKRFLMLCRAYGMKLDSEGMQPQDGELS